MAKPMTLRDLVNWVPPDYTMVAGLPSLASLSRPAYRGLSRATMVASVPIQDPDSASHSGALRPGASHADISVVT